jgi:hypothetical protein
MNILKVTNLVFGERLIIKAAEEQRSRGAEGRVL